MKWVELNIPVLLFSVIFLVLSKEALSEELRRDVPLWNQVDKLICVGQARLECTEEVCEKGESSAVWEVDFSKRKIQFLTSTKSRYFITDVFFKYYSTIDASKHTIFFKGRLMDFNLDVSSLWSEIDAQVVDSYRVNDEIPQIQRMTYKCHVQ